MMIKDQMAAVGAELDDAIDYLRNRTSGIDLNTQDLGTRVVRLEKGLDAATSNMATTFGLTSSRISELEGRVDALEDIPDGPDNPLPDKPEIIVVEDRTSERHAAGWGDDRLDGKSRERPKKSLMAARAAMANVETGNPMGTLILHEGVFDLHEEFKSGAGYLAIKGHGSGGLSQDSTIRYWPRTGAAIHIESIGKASMHDVLFEDFSVELMTKTGQERSVASAFDIEAGYNARAIGVKTKGGAYGWRFTGASANYDLHTCSGTFHNAWDGLIDRGAFIALDKDADADGGGYSSNIGINLGGAPEVDGCGSLLYWNAGGSGGFASTGLLKIEGGAAHGAMPSSWNQAVLVEVGSPYADLARTSLYFGLTMYNLGKEAPTFVRVLGREKILDPAKRKLNVYEHKGGDLAFWGLGHKFQKQLVEE